MNRWHRRTICRQGIVCAQVGSRESHTVVIYMVAVYDTLFTCVVMDAATYNAGWGLGQEMARTGLEMERLPPLYLGSRATPS